MVVYEYGPPMANDHVMEAFGDNGGYAIVT